MNKGIKIGTLIVLLIGVFFSASLTAQEKKVVKKITIIEETTNADGTKTITTTVKEGKDAEVKVKKGKGEKHVIKQKIHKDGMHKGDDIFVVKKGGEVKVEVEVIEEDGEKKVIIKKSGDGEDGEVEVIELKGDDINQKEGNVFFMEKDGDLDMEIIEKDGKKVIIMRSGEEHDHEGMVWTEKEGDVLKWIEEDVSGPFIGIYLEENADSKGVLVKDVVEGGPAEKAGLQAEDVIIGINGEEISNNKDLYAVLGELEIGDEAEIKYERGEDIGKSTLKVANKADFSSSKEEIELHEDMPMLFQEEEDLKLGVYFASDQGENGLEVQDVVEGSVAASAGIQKGDIIYDFAGEKVEDVYDVLKMLKRANEGDTNIIKVMRNGEKVELKAKF